MFQLWVYLPVLKFKTTFVNFTLVMFICTHLPLGNNRIQLSHANFVPVLAQIMARRVKGGPPLQLHKDTRHSLQSERQREQLQTPREGEKLDFASTLPHRQCC